MARLIIPALEAPAMMLSTLMKDCITHLASVEGYSRSTLDNYERTHRQFLAFLMQSGRRDEIESFDDAACFGFMEDLGRRGANVNTINNRLAAISTLAIYGMRARNKRGRPYLLTNPTKTFKWPRTVRANIPIITPDEVSQFLDHPLNGGKAVIRDLFFDTGLRVSEIAEANVSDFFKVSGEAYIEVTVKSRGRKRRQQFPVSADLAASLESYLRTRHKPTPDAPLIVRRDGQRYTRSHIGRVIALIGKAAGITRLRMSPHKIRHMVNVWGRLGGADALTRSALLGHASPASIAAYEHVIPHELHAARAQQREGMRRYLGGAESRFMPLPQIEGESRNANDEFAQSVAAGATAGPEKILWNTSYLTRTCMTGIVAGRANQFHKRSGALPDVALCACGCASTDHDLTVDAGGQFVGACLGCSTCERFEAAADPVAA